MANCLILYYTTAWSLNVNPKKIPLPDGCELTTDRRRYAEAQAVVFHIPTLGRMRWWGMPKKLPGQIFIAWSMECEENYPVLRSPRFMSRFDLTMTYRTNANIFTSYFAQYGTPEQVVAKFTQAPEEKNFDRDAAMFISSPFNRSGRFEYAKDLLRHLKIDSYGKQFHNRDIENDQGESTKLQLIQRYPFTIAFENAIATDYVTEKFFDPLVSGSVPIYLGAPNIKEFAPGDMCFIDVRKFPRAKMLAEYVQSLVQDRDAYEEYFQWKQKPLAPRFLQLLHLQEKDAVLRLCEQVLSLLSRPAAMAESQSRVSVS